MPSRAGRRQPPWSWSAWPSPDGSTPRAISTMWWRRSSKSGSGGPRSRGTGSSSRLPSCGTLLRSLQRQVDRIDLGPHRPEPSFQVVGQRGGMVEGAGMEPDPVRLQLPGSLGGLGQQILTPTSSEESREETEVGDLHRPVLVLAELE